MTLDKETLCELKSHYQWNCGNSNQKIEKCSAILCALEKSHTDIRTGTRSVIRMLFFSPEEIYIWNEFWSDIYCKSFVYQILLIFVNNQWPFTCTMISAVWIGRLDFCMTSQCSVTLTNWKRMKWTQNVAGTGIYVMIMSMQPWHLLFLSALFQVVSNIVSLILTL